MTQFAGRVATASVAAAVALAALAAPAVSPPPSVAVTNEQLLFLEAWRAVDRAYVDKGFNGQTWFRVREQFLKAERMDSREQTYAAIRKLLATLEVRRLPLPLRRRFSRSHADQRCARMQADAHVVCRLCKAASALCSRFRVVAVVVATTPLRAAHSPPLASLPCPTAPRPESTAQHLLILLSRFERLFAVPIYTCIATRSLLPTAGPVHSVPGPRATGGAAARRQRLRHHHRHRRRGDIRRVSKGEGRAGGGGAGGGRAGGRGRRAAG